MFGRGKYKGIKLSTSLNYAGESHGESHIKLCVSVCVFITFCIFLLVIKIL